MIIEKFNDTIETYMHVWHNSTHIHLGAKNSIIKRTIRYYRIKNKLNRLCKKLCKNSPLNMEQMKDDADIIQLMDMWLQFDVSKMSETLKGDYVIEIGRASCRERV